MTSEKRPAKKFQAGGISAALWKGTMQLRDGSQIETVSVTLDRRYKDTSGNWKSSSFLKPNDVPKAILVLQKAYEYMVAKRGDEDDGPVAAEEVIY